MSVKRTHLLRGKQCCNCDAAAVCAAAGSCGLQRQLEDSGDSTSNKSGNSRHTTAQLPSILLQNFIAIELYPRHRLYSLAEGLWHATSAAASPAHLRVHMDSEQQLFLYRKSSMTFVSFILPSLSYQGNSLPGLAHCAMPCFDSQRRLHKLCFLCMSIPNMGIKTSI